MPFKQSKLWQRTLATQDNDPENFQNARERLRHAFIQTRNSVKPLVEQIGRELPQLTNHDITHLDALWDVADVVIGDDYPINPAEAFILGMAFLLHDAATSSVAFPNLKEGIRASVEWKDFVAQKGWADDELIEGSDHYKLALFEVLRLRHAQQAEKLLTQSWSGLSDRPCYLLEDVALCNFYGAHIGKVASSHGWDIAKVEGAWANASPITPHSSLNVPSGVWTVDLFKVALILRCTDAAHIDSRRANDMLAAFTQPSGYSAEHWRFQNHLGSAACSQQGELYWSATAFQKEESDAWWLCYDTQKMIDRELRASQRLLKNNGRTPFQSIGVEGIHDTESFKINTPTEGWKPVDVNFTASNIPNIIEKFGGKKLYGDEPWMPVRELIQNAADAVRARRVKRNNDQTLGKITVSMYEEATDGPLWLEVVDTGIGMSQFVLSEVLLDFGRSLWSDPAMRSELPNVLAKGFKPMGQFGIGFMSVFMLGDEVIVSSWRDGEAEDNQHTLHIRQGVKTRPTLSTTDADARLQEYGTRVRVKLNITEEKLLPKGRDEPYVKLLDLTLPKLVGAIAPALDIDVDVKYKKNPSARVITANDWGSLTDLALYNRIAPFYDNQSFLEHRDSLIDIKNDNRDLIGRINLVTGGGWTGFGVEKGVLVHQGILVSKMEYFGGILFAENNVDLSRESAVPAIDAQTLYKFAENYPLKNAEFNSWKLNRLLCMGLPFENIQWRVGEPFQNNQSFKSWVVDNDFQEIIMTDRSVGCPDEYSQKEFDEDFEEAPNVIYVNLRESSLDKWAQSCYEGTRYTSRSLWDLIEARLTETFPNNFNVSLNANCCVGTIHGKNINQKVTLIQLNRKLDSI
jgi:hypothetical protein